MHRDDITSHGIGLFTVINIIELYKGQVSIEGVQDEGTLITIRLANSLIAFDEVTESLEPSTVVVARTCRNVLFVDDSDAIYIINKSIFESLQLDCQTFAVKNGAEAMKYLLGAEPYGDQTLYPIPDLIFLDSSMPVMGGVSFAKAFSQIRDRFKIDIQIAMLSSMPMEKLKMDSKHLGIDFYIQKPLNKEKLLTL